MTSFSEAVTRGDQTTVELVPVIDPRTGETIDLSGLPHDTLVDVFLALQERERQFKEWRTVVEDELVRRHGDRKAAQVVGDHEVDVDRGYTRVWDWEDLDAVIEDLTGRGLLRGGDVLGLILAQEPKVDGRKAAQLLNRVQGDALVELRRCFSWQQRGRAKVKVTPVAQLEP